jgi:G3E family GTPase
MDILWQNVKDATRSVTVVRTLKSLIALIVIVLITGAYGMSQALQANTIELTKTRLINQMDNKDTNKDIELLKTRIKKHEGNKLGKAVMIPYYLEYDDANGNRIKEDWLTGGFGTKLSKNHKEPEGGYTTEYWNKRFDERFDTAHKGALELVGTETDYRAIGVVTEMMYQMGVDGVSKFKNTLKYMKNGEWNLASVEMLDSKWAIQTPNRATKLSKVIKNIK